MTILLRCPVCSTPYYAPDQLVERTAGCRVCRTQFVIQAPPGMSDDEVAVLVASDPLRAFLRDQNQAEQLGETKTAVGQGPG
jgi:hypothetical protein